MGFEICRNFDFAANTTYGCGGVAQIAYYPETQNELIELYDNLSSKKYFVLGNGSNVLACDGVYDGSIIVTKKLNEIRLTSDGYLYCECGVTVTRLINYCKLHGLGGLEFLNGIPATVGGLCYMNAGIAGKYINEVIVSVIIYDSKKRILTNKDCQFAYKNSIMRDINCVILGCLFKIYQSSSQKVNELCRYYMGRRSHIPKGKSCGCVFKNPEGASAGAIIEAAGLKGHCIGDAIVSEQHANFIINRGRCSQDVYDLISYVKRTVYRKFSTELEEEVCYLGDFK